MGPTVIYEEEITLLDPSSAPEVNVATTSTTQSLPRPTVMPVDRPAAFVRWANERDVLLPEAAKAKVDFEVHTGLQQWQAYIQSPDCRKMMNDLLTVPFVGLEAELVKHWRGFFLSQTAKALAQAFKEKVRAEVLVPTTIDPGPQDPLKGRLLSFANGGITSVKETFAGYLAADGRFERGTPIVVLSWGDFRPWSFITPDKGFVQVGTFHYTENRTGKVWDARNVISESYLKHLDLERMQNHFSRFQMAYDEMISYFDAQDRSSALHQYISLLDRKQAAWGRVSLPTNTLNELLQRAELFEIGDPAAPSGLLLDGPAGTGKTLIARSLAESMQCTFIAVTLADVKQRELGVSSQKVRAFWNQARQNQPAVLFFDECEGVFGRRGAAETDVIADEIVKTILAEWNDNGVKQRILVIGATNRPGMIDDAIQSRFDWKLTIPLPEQHERLEILRREMQAVAGDCEVPEEMGELTQGMSGRDLRNLASQVRTNAYPKTPTAENFYEAIRSARKSNNVKVDEEATWETLAVSPDTLSELKLTCQLLRSAESWRKKGIEVPQSLLLYGPPGTGKTQVGRTLANESGLRFLAATTAEMKATHLGVSGNRMRLFFERARSMAPSILFLDELDIVAPKRGGTNDPLTDEIVGQLLQEMDGIERRDGEVFVVAATNKPDSIDHAVLSRFLRKIEVPLPNHQSRTKLLTSVLMKKNRSFDLTTVVEELAGRTEGKNHRDLLGYIGEAEKNAVIRAIAMGGPEHFTLSLEDFD